MGEKEGTCRPSPTRPPCLGRDCLNQDLRDYEISGIGMGSTIQGRGAGTHGGPHQLVREPSPCLHMRVVREKSRRRSAPSPPTRPPLPSASQGRAYRPEHHIRASQEETDPVRWRTGMAVGNRDSCGPGFFRLVRAGRNRLVGLRRTGHNDGGPRPQSSGAVVGPGRNHRPHTDADPTQSGGRSNPGGHSHNRS